MTVESSIESIMADISIWFTSFQDQVFNYANRKLWNMSAPELSYPTKDDVPDFKKDISVMKDGERLFDPTNITGSFPTYQAPAEIDWTALYAALDLNEKRVWQSSELDALSAKIQALITGDETWLNADYQQNAFDIDRDRRLQTLDDSLRLLASRHAARGFRIPTSMLTAQENEIVQKYQYDNTTSSRDLVKSVIEAAKNFQQYAIGKGMDYEQINMGFTQAYNQAILEPIKLKVETYRQQLIASAEVFSSKVKEITLRLEAEKASWELTGTYNETVINAELAPWKIYKAWVDAVALEAQQETEIFKTKVDSDVKALIAGYTSIPQIAQTGSSITINKKTAA